MQRHLVVLNPAHSARVYHFFIVNVDRISRVEQLLG
jgi:hypothetical protein